MDLQTLGNSKLADLCDPDVVAAGVEVLNLLYLVKGKDAPATLAEFDNHALVQSLVANVPKLLTASKPASPAEAKDKDFKPQTVSGKDAADIIFTRMKVQFEIPQAVYL